MNWNPYNDDLEPGKLYWLAVTTKNDVGIDEWGSTIIQTWRDEIPVFYDQFDGKIKLMGNLIDFNEWKENFVNVTITHYIELPRNPNAILNFC